MNGQYPAKNARMGKRGAFVNGIWHCDCEPRMPAEKFQTKNGGKNHGRWFYTCQKSQPKRCSFFLWQDDAQRREQAAVLGNSTTEPNIQNVPQTPRRAGPQPEEQQPLTPFSKVKLTNDEPPSYSKRRDDTSQGTLDFEREDSYGWNSSGDEGLAAIADDTLPSRTSASRKAIKNSHYDSPGKHVQNNKDIFQTPSTSEVPSGLMSPLNTASERRRVPGQAPSSATLVEDVLRILGPANISHVVEEQLIQVLNRYELRTQGIAKGRDITRLAVQTKEKKIAELQSRILTLEADRETSRTVIAHLKQDIATSPKRPKRPQQPLRQNS